MHADLLRHVLCIDNKGLLTERVREMLRHHDIDMQIVRYSPGVGVDTLSNTPPDLFLCIGSDEADGTMNDMVRDFLASAPVMIVSGKSVDSDREKVIRVLVKLFSAKGKLGEEESKSSSLFDIELLQDALQKGEFELWYQPIVSCNSGFVSGFEALIRWNHPERCEIIFPDCFIPTIERYEMIIPFGFWIIEEACKQLKEWQNRYPLDPPIRISVNLSARQFTCPELCERIIEIIDSHGIDPSTIGLEITESAFMEDMENANLMLLKLKAKKVKIYLDDFGTGFASLSYLLHFPVDVIKIDKSFVKWMHVDEQSEEIVRSVVMLAHNLKMKVVAEGVESDDHLGRLEEFGCDYIQGYFYSKPLNREDAGRFIDCYGKSPARVKGCMDKG
ncbi:MAG TPA: EAL domain-containing protein [Spirochaetota bacterium]